LSKQGGVKSFFFFLYKANTQQNTNNKMQRSYIIDHMENGMHEWCTLEYKHMLSNIGPDHLYFSSLTDECLNGLPEELKAAQCHQEDVLSLPGIKKEDICLLDPAGTSELAPEDGDKFKLFLFGGILGDHPPRG
jgi:ribosome biogenesis SPOUT family RNA methylase Rps3